MTLRRMIEILQWYADTGIVELDNDVVMRLRECDNDVPVASISYDDGNVVLCNLEEF